MKASVGAEADQELSDAVLRYARDGGADLGLAFAAEFERAVTLLCEHPKLAPVWRNGRRRFPMRRFPYSIIYYLGDGELRVVAIAHHRRRPGYWSGRQ